jgi:hypothetical protein
LLRLKPETRPALSLRRDTVISDNPAHVRFHTNPPNER